VGSVFLPHPVQGNPNRDMC